MVWTKEVIMEFLDLYEEEESIWNPKNADYKDRNKAHDAWKRIQNRISVECSLSDLKKKKEILMATYRRVALKVKNSNKTGAGTQETYKPEWFAYEKMSFLRSIYTPRKTKTSDKGPENEQDDSTNEHVTPDPESCCDEESSDAAATEVAVIDRGGPPSRKRKAEKTAKVEKRMDEAFKLLKQVVDKPKVPAKDESSLFCDLLCLKLKALDDDTREIAMHEINNLMFSLKKPKMKHPCWSHNNDQQPEYFQYAQGLTSPNNESEHSASSGASSGQNPEKSS